jgi:hypothetical protein
MDWSVSSLYIFRYPPNPPSDLNDLSNVVRKHLYSLFYFGTLMYSHTNFLQKIIRNNHRL